MYWVGLAVNEILGISVLGLGMAYGLPSSRIRNACMECNFSRHAVDEQHTIPPMSSLRACIFSFCSVLQTSNDLMNTAG